MNPSVKAAPTAQIDQLATIWAIVEARQDFPAMIVVTGATQADDTQLIARGLAQVAHEAGQRTAYLKLGIESRAGGTPASYATLSISPRGSPREAFDSAAASWRTMYDVVMIDATTMGSDSLGAHAARVGDCVVISVCDQRRVVPEDRRLKRLLHELRASIVGVVITPPIDKTQGLLVSRERSRLEATALQ